MSNSTVAMLESRLQQLTVASRRVRKLAGPYMPLICRVLLVSTFIEDGVRILFEMRHQVDFLRHEYGLPSFLATFMLLANILVSFIAVFIILSQKRFARGAYEQHAAYMLIGCVVYQQVLYGRHSPIGSGNVGFLVRNLCLSGSLMLITIQSRMASGRSALPMGLLDGQTDTKATAGYLQLASRIMLVLLALEFLTTLGVVGTIFTIPVIIAVLVGYQLQISGTILLALYFLHNVLNSAFWKVSGSYISQIMQYEYVARADHSSTNFKGNVLTMTLYQFVQQVFPNVIYYGWLTHVNIDRTGCHICR